MGGSEKGSRVHAGNERQQVQRDRKTQEPDRREAEGA